MTSPSASIPTCTAFLGLALTSVQKKVHDIHQRGRRASEDLGDRLHFAKEFFKDPLANGSVVPSSKKLAKEVVKYIPKNPCVRLNQVSRFYLEVGPGTGPFTVEIVKRLRPFDRLDVIELNPSYCEKLKKKFPQKNVHVHCLPIQEWNPDFQYDAVVHGLPLNAFPFELVNEIFDKLKKLTKDEGTISYFEYKELSNLCLKVYSSQVYIELYTDAKKNRLEQVLQIKDKIFNEIGIEVKTVKENFPSADAVHLKIRKIQNDQKQTTLAVPALPNPA